MAQTVSGGLRLDLPRSLGQSAIAFLLGSGFDLLHKPLPRFCP
ncbi:MULTISPECIES: hypothetical protein [Cyanophyceae]|nr:hypothetical protein [Phormidium sp. FACHB-592]